MKAVKTRRRGTVMGMSHFVASYLMMLSFGIGAALLVRPAVAALLEYAGVADELAHRVADLVHSIFLVSLCFAIFRLVARNMSRGGVRDEEQGDVS